MAVIYGNMNDKKFRVEGGFMEKETDDLTQQLEVLGNELAIKDYALAMYETANKRLKDISRELAVLAQEKHSGLYSHLYDTRLNNVLKRLELEMESEK
jgi:hypothetical protein